MFTTLPTMISIEEFSNSIGLKRHQGYDLARQMPPGVVIRLGRRIRLNAERLQEWLAAGGHLAQV